MLQNKVKKIALSVLSIATLVGSGFVFNKVSANDENSYEVTKVTFADKNAEKELYKDGNYTFKYRKATECLIIEDNRNNHRWTSGINLTKDENNLEKRISSSYLEYANSFIETKTITDKDGSIKFSDSSDSDRGAVTLYKVKGEDNHYRMDILCKAKFKKSGEDKQKTHELYTIRIHLYFSEEGLDIKIPYEEMEGEFLSGLRTLYLMPFLASSDGSLNLNNERELENGYIVVPDGSGSIVNFQKNATSYSSYSCSVYGSNPGYLQGVSQDFMVKENKVASLPIYGCVKEDKKAAFVAYASEGAQHMEIAVEPESGGEYIIKDNVYAFPKFTYNMLYTEIFNKTGAGNKFAKLPNGLNYDVSMSYRFLANDKANYSGMANAYKDELIEDGILTPKTYEYNETPIRLDFIMADSESSVMGKKEVVVTDAEEVDSILTDVRDDLKINNIVTSLQGWSKGGANGNDPRKVKYSSKIASKHDLKKLVEKYKEDGIDISVTQDYLNFNSEQLSLSGNASKSINGYYIEHYYDGEFADDHFFARSDKFGKWMNRQTKALRKQIEVDSMTIEGVTNQIVTHSTSITIEKSMENTRKALNKVRENGLKINADRPNSYLFDYVDRYFNAPVNDSQYIIENSPIPFLQLVLNGCMEVYTEYSNFSFYNQESILKMIDYNVNPSFILSHDSSHLLATTNSSNYFSTEYSLYEEKIGNIYNQVNEVLSQVLNDRWVNREVKGKVSINTYASGKKVYINYSNEDVVIDGVNIAKESYEVR